MSSKEYFFPDGARVPAERLTGAAAYSPRAHVDLQFLLIGAALFAAVAYYRRK